MKNLFLVLCFLSIGSCCIANAQVSFGSPILINDDWKFIKKDVCRFSASDYDDSSWDVVTLPHDWSVHEEASPSNPSCMGYLPTGIGTYSKSLYISKSLEGKKIYIYFEGVYNRSTVWINGHNLGTRPNGYVSFMYDMTPYLKYGETNRITVRVDHSRNADSRWYTGSGIYRNVWLIESEPVHIAQWGIYARQEEVSSVKAVLDVQVDIKNEKRSKEKLVMENELLSPSGKRAANVRSSIVISSADSLRTTVKLTVKNPELWEMDNPMLYTLRTSLYDGQKRLETVETKVGFRNCEFDPDSGFFINGKNIKIKGVCLHHDAGVLGAAVPEAVLRERLLTLKSLGCNAIRTTHNPQAPSFYDLCDELGFLVLNEAFDEWEFPKRKWKSGWNIGVPGYDGSYDFFESWGEKDLADMVRRDRNHPCVFAWSIGNEVDYPNDPYSHPVLDGSEEDGFSQPIFGGYNPDAPDAMRLGDIAMRLARIVRDLDPSRPVTAGLAGVAMSNQTDYPSSLDIAGYNYTESRYTTDHLAYPERVIYGSENRHDYNAWKSVRDNQHISGQFLWTGIDYLGESNAWPSRGFGSGLIDLAGNVKSLGWYRKSLWTTEPFVHIGTFRGNVNPLENASESWNYQTGEQVDVVCFTNCAEARLEQDGQTVGERKKFDDVNGYIVWRIPFKAGKLEVIASDASGNDIASHSLLTHGPAVSIQADIETDGGISIVSITLTDAKGIRVTDSDAIIKTDISGPAEILGIESGNNTDMTLFNGYERMSYKGRVKAYVKHYGDGPVSISISSGNIPPVTLEL